MIDFTWIIGLTALYFAVILGLVVYSRVKETNRFLPGLSEFFLAGRQLGPAVLAATFVASGFSTFSVLGFPGLIYVHGLGAAIFPAIAIFIGGACILIFGLKMWEAAQESRVFSPIEIVAQSYGCRKLGLFMAVALAIFLMPYISLQLVGMGKFIEAYTQGQIGYTVGVGSMMIIVLAYLFLGGMRAVAYTDYVQMIAIFIGLIVGLGFILDVAGINLIELFSQAQASESRYFEMPGPAGGYSVIMSLTAAFVLTGIFFQPHLMTRCMMASCKRDVHIIVWAFFIGSLIIAALAFSYALYAHATYGAGLAPNEVMGQIFRDMAESGMFGLLISGLMLMGAFGAAMSTADSLLISIGQIGTRDMIRPFLTMSPKRQILISKGIMFAILALAFVTGLNPPQFMTDLAMYSAAGAALLAPTILCFFWSKRSLLAAYLSIAFGLIALGGAFVYANFYDGDLFGTHVGFLPIVLSFVVYFAICFLIDFKKQKQIA